MKCKKAAVVVAGLFLALGAASPAMAEGEGATANGAAIGSSGLVSGNVIQVPIHGAVNACGNSLNLIGLLNPASGNACVNT
ncbi:chaplin [Streptomyces sp. NPDC015346]|uniref:chaplin n=1 Tax=Streptomyces sp. NPDC015346 TaxID=3364954 RepID=UPI003702C22C